ncbi:hypothetical protein GI584_01610 [Gracilibacillus salitolerans]|uniref:Uncharacterized protein n=1 Tax=Gracilibacillus salitolerans TaxID=2663022 RepID=A0A5Q2TDY5_9BACI|nr:hypothetical protein [Gracilibacillus salitolerans]QGH32826.1 hypothetical protein GI584_01610 [Gracilibacillus salitolerans]
MIIKNAATLKKDYFISYMKLIMNTMKCSIHQAKEMTFDRLFKNDPERLGTTSYQEFLIAYEELKGC